MALDPKKLISPNLQEVFIDPDTGLPLVNGKVYYYKDNARSTLKTVYELTGTYGAYGYAHLDNPVTLGSAGSPINASGDDIRVYYYPYDANGTNVELYFIRVTDEDGNTKLERQAWPNLVASSTASEFNYNFIRNANFYGWGDITSYNNVKTGSVDYDDVLLDDWGYEQDDPVCTIAISRGTFLTSETAVPNNPTNYLIYNNTAAGSSQTYNRFFQTYDSVYTYNGTNVAVSVWMKQISNGSAAGTVGISFVQYFGSGGSASVKTVVKSQQLTIGDWINVNGTVPIPSISGKTVQPDSKLILCLDMPIDQTAEIHIAMASGTEGTQIPVLVEQTNNSVVLNTESAVGNAVFKTGDVKATLKTTADTGWLMMNDQTIGNPSSGATNTGLSLKALFTLIWNNVSNAYAPIYDSSGNLSTRSGSAEIDFDANKRLSLTKTLGRVIASAGQATLATTFTAATGTPATMTLSVPLSSAESFYTGVPVQLTTTHTLPAGLNLLTTYYVRYLSSNTISFWLTETDAVNLTNPIAVTDTGTGTHTVTIDYSNRTLGQTLGEENHSLITAEIPSHTHAPLSGAFVADSPDNSVYGGGGLGSRTATTKSTGGSTAHNNMQPTVFLKYMIKI